MGVLLLLLLHWHGGGCWNSRRCHTLRLAMKLLQLLLTRMVSWQRRSNHTITTVAPAVVAMMISAADVVVIVVVGFFFLFSHALIHLLDIDIVGVQ